MRVAPHRLCVFAASQDARRLFPGLRFAEGRLHAASDGARRHPPLRHGGDELQQYLPLTLVLLSGCVPAYRPPAEGEPHAVVKVRRVYDEQPGEAAREVVLVDGHRALGEEAPAAQMAAPHNDAIRVHPRPTTLRVTSGFFHHQLQQVRESYLDRVPYQKMETYDCGTFQSPRTCTRSVTDYKLETKYRTVMKNVEVSDGDCSGEVRFAPAAGHTYLLQFTYQSARACRLTCFEQKAGAGGEVTQSPCPAK